MPTSRTQSTPWYASIVTRITLVFAGLLLGTLSLLGWLSWRTSRGELVAQAHQSMDHGFDVADDLFHNVERVLDDNLEALITNPAVTEWCARMEPGDTAGLAQARERVAAFMGPFINGRIFFSQMRLIGADSAGTEIIRFERVGKQVQRTADDRLQRKGDRPYWRITNAAPPGTRLSFPIDLNREEGQVALPEIPTLRYSAPLFTPKGVRAGMVVINTDMRMIFGQLLSMADSGRVMVLAREDGEVLIHPDSTFTFRFEHGGSKKLIDVLPTPEQASRAESLVGFRNFTLGPSKDTYTLATTQPMSGLLSTLHRKRNGYIVLFGLIAAGAIVLMGLFASRAHVELARLTMQMERYAVGKQEALPVGRRDEFGRMARGLHAMQERIDARMRELEGARAAAEASDRQRRELLANMSHEVRTPLSAIIGMSDGVDPAALGENDREKLAVVRRSAQRLKGLVDDLLTHARIGEGKLALHYASVDARTLVRDIVLAHRPTADAKALRIRIELDDLPQLVHTDGLRLHQVIDNLVGNAVRFTESGEVVIAADVLDGRTLRILVWDTGPGIPLEAQQRIFERFERATSSEQEHGAGLGLAITKRVVDLLGGTIELISTSGQGSRFMVRLPIAAGPSPAAPAPTSARDTSGLCILYVEDVATNRMLVQEWATNWGWKLRVAESGEEALDACARDRFDLLLIDLGLGHGINGLELAKRLRAGGQHRHTPMIALTAYAQDGEDEEALKAGMNDRVTKPVDRDRLLSAVAFWCGRSGPEQEPPDLTALAGQYDHDAYKLQAVYAQYRVEFLQRRLSLRAALRMGEEKALNDARHSLRPHWRLLGLDRSIALLDALHVRNGDQGLAEMEDVFRGCDRAFLLALRAEVTTV